MNARPCWEYMQPSRRSGRVNMEALPQRPSDADVRHIGNLNGSMMPIRRPRFSLRIMIVAVFSVAVIVVAGLRLNDYFYTYPLSNVVDAINHAALKANRPELCVTEDFLVDAIIAQVANSTGKEQLLSGSYSRVASKFRRIASRRRVPLGDGFNMTENGILWMVVSVPPDVTVTPGPGFGLIIRHPSIGKGLDVALSPMTDYKYSWDGSNWIRDSTPTP